MWVGLIKGISTCDTFQVLPGYQDKKVKLLLTHSVMALEQFTRMRHLPAFRDFTSDHVGSAEGTDYKWGAN